jgi:hypothetical protein
MTPRTPRTTSWTDGESADLMDDRRCRATSKRSGERCKRYASPGGRVCVIHGGATPAVRAAAQRRLAEREAAALLEVLWDPNAEPITNPVEALQALAGRLRHAANVLGARVDTETLDGPTALAWARVVRELRLSLEGMERLDLTGKQIELEQDRAQIVTSAFLGALAVVSSLLPTDRDLMVRAFLRGLGRDPERPELEVVRGEVE